MPIIINDDNSVSSVDVKGSAKAMSNNYSPKFFNKNVLTGKGGQHKGLLNDSRDPKMFPKGYPVIDPNLTYGSTYNKDIKIYNIPCFIISDYMWKFIIDLERPDMSDLTLIAEKGQEKIYLSMPIYTAQVEEYQVPVANSTPTTQRDISVNMEMFLFSVKDANNTMHTAVSSLQALSSKTNNYGGNTFYRKVINNIFVLRQVHDVLTANGYTVNRQVMDDFVQNYSIYNAMCRASEMWQTEIADRIVNVLIKNVNAIHGSSPDNPIWGDPTNSVSDILSRLEKYSVPLNQYQNMYAGMSAVLSSEILNNICKSNLNLRLSNTLEHMDKNRALLEKCPCINHVKSKIPYSKEQQEAIESTSPLTLVQSGAGTGKSTVILGRIDHMIANGIDPNDITVLSFTNAAANHITDLKPNIHSMTIASMLHTIYANNYPTHQLSSLSTIINSLDIYFNPVAMNFTLVQSNFIKDFKYVLERLRDNNEYTKANNFVEDNIDMVIYVLDTIQQTSLELESIICYQKMDTLVEPDETKTKHLIIDEVQDNSIAEFIYSIKYTDKHKCSMYIVGDCSQTLYEFRSSNPKALNVLESSGVFETHKLQTNYRSNQEILDFANVLLGNIEANQYANIQLKANSLAPVTLQSFQDAVTLMYNRLPNKNNTTIDGLLMHAIMFDTKDYVEDKLNKGEQVCILAPHRYTLGTIEKYLTAQYPNKKIVSLIPKRQYDSTIFTKFIAEYWHNIKFTPPLHLIETIETVLMSHIPNLTYKAQNIQKVKDSATKLMTDFKAQHEQDILNWENQVMSSVMTQVQLLDEVQKLMISFEIKRNAISQALLSSRNAEAKKASDVDNANFIISTIHSAKGLEFDNVIVFHQSESEATIDESTKRMYYVAFTRARKTEYIFSYDTMARPKIQGDYDSIIKLLKQKTAKTTAVNAGNTDDDTNATESNNAADETNIAAPNDTAVDANISVSENTTDNTAPVNSESKPA